MSDYIIAVDWAGKDALSDSSAAKVISGADFNSEFTAARTAINSKADLNGDATESFNATTANAGTNTTQVATTAFVTAALAAQVAYPVGAIFTTTVAYANSAAVVAAIGGTTWTAFGSGRVLVGVDTGDSDFNTVEKEGGSSTHTLTIAEMPAHTHGYQKHTSNSALSIHDIAHTVNSYANTQTTSTGGGAAHNNLQPYITVYMWKRTA